jgi:electron transport complex protein RnfD
VSDRDLDLVLTTAPFLPPPSTTPKIMFEVLAALVPVLFAAVWVFGVGALLTVAAAVAGAVCTEWAGTRGGLRSTLRDGSGVLTGVLLAFTLPPGMPLWMAFLGGVVGIGLGKLVWGGLGQNLFNPALVGRAFLQAAFPTAITTFHLPGGAPNLLDPPDTLFAMPFMRAPLDVDALTTATPLGLAKFESTVTELGPLLFGNTAGSLGETCGLVLIVCGVWLAARRIFDWRLLVSCLLGVVVVSGGLHLVDPAACPPPQFMLLSGGLLFGAVFMVTDPVTTPTTPRGAWVFGLGVGFLVVLIRAYGGLAEGVMYAILLMNAITPLINAWTQPRQFGAPS